MKLATARSMIQQIDADAKAAETDPKYKSAILKYRALAVQLMGCESAGNAQAVDVLAEIVARYNAAITELPATLADPKLWESAYYALRQCGIDPLALWTEPPNPTEN